MEYHKRRNYFIDKNFQTKFIVKFCLVVIFSSLAIGSLLFVLLKSFTTVAIENIHVTVKSTSDFILPIVIEILLIVSVLSALCVVMLTLFASHKISGPLYRLKKEVEKIKEGDLRANFTTRKNDQLKELSVTFTDMDRVLIAKYSELKEKIEELKKSLDKQGESKRESLEKIRELEEALNYFKI